MSKATPDQLRDAITEMDSLAQSAFSRIASMAQLALLSMEQPSTHSPGAGGMDHIAHVLEAINAMARDIENHMNATAEGVGCNYVDSAQRKRWDAGRTARETAIDGRA